MSLFSGLGEFHEKVHSLVEKGVKNTVSHIHGLVDSDRRHDDEDEKARDETLMGIRRSHRFESFAGEREGNIAKWHVDGHDFFWAVSELIDRATESIFILDWWLSPEIYLRRPPAQYPEWRLDRLLEKKAKQGVKVHIIVYKEVEVTMSMSSEHTKHALNALHPNIAVMRHPDHIGSADAVQFWSHHEKVVVVDNHWASIGGLDLCFGRWDTHTHPMADVHPTGHDRTLFPGQDYNNARVLDFQQVDHYVSNQLSSLETGRMPWHDVHMTVTGPVVLDIIQHYVERWNEVKKRKYADDPRYEWIALPHNIAVAPNEPVAKHPHYEEWREKGNDYKERFLGNPNWTKHGEQQRSWGHDSHSTGPLAPSAKVQVVRSVSDWSHGYLTEHSIQNAYKQLILEAKHFIYIENQFFISNTENSGSVVNTIAEALVTRILQAARAGEHFKVIVIIPEVPGFAGDVKETSAILTIMAAQWRTINRGGSSIMEKVRNEGFDPSNYIAFYHLRSYDRLNAPYESFIKEMEEKSGVTFHNAQVALARKWIGKIDEEWAQNKVAIAKPVATKDGLVEEGDNKKVEEVHFPETEEEANEIIRKFETAAGRDDEDVSDSIAQHALLDATGLLEEKWLGTEEEERNSYVTELLYIHSKLMIVDDRKVIMGSANINDRSQKGDGDSEIALVVEDTDMIESSMDGQPYQAARFAATLRRALFKEHLGLIKPQVCEPQVPTQITSYMTAVPAAHKDTTQSREDQLVADPLSDEFTALWDGTAKRNTKIFGEIFKTVPSNNVRNWDQYEKYVPKVKAGHVATDIDLQALKERLTEVKGHLVQSPLEFLIEENDLVTGLEWTKLNALLPVYI